MQPQYLHKKANRYFNQNGIKLFCTADDTIPTIYGRIGNLEVRIASKVTDILKCMRLRYEVFYEEKLASPNTLATILRLDYDAYDRRCDHLIVFDNAYKKNVLLSAGDQRAVATYRILREDVAKKNKGFYSQREYNLEPLLRSKSSHYRFMELGRSCVKKSYRSKRSIELLWQGLWQYAQMYHIDVMIGCASFEGTDIQKHAHALSYLYHHASSPKEWYCKAHQAVYQPMNLLTKENINIDEALKDMPPLIKGYLRLGAFVGDGAVIDHTFGTTDVLIILPIERIHPRYFAYFGTSEDQKIYQEAA